MANQKQSFGYAVIITASVAYACGGGGGGGGGSGGCGLFEAPKSKVVYCNDAQGTVLQWNEDFCAATPAEVCSVYFHKDLDHDAAYPDATLETVPEGGGEGLPVPACVCQYGNVVSDACIDGQNQDSTPTTSASDDETGDTPEPTGGDDPEVYICLKADEKCAKVNYAFSPLLDDWSECWSDPPPCVEATSQADAIKQCEKKCVDRQGEIAAEVAKYNADGDNDDDKIIKLPLDCKYDDDPPEGRPRLATDTDACAPAANNGALPVWGGETPLHAYSGKMSLTDVSGGGAEMANMWGYLSYETFDCKDSSCTIRFDAIEGLADDVSGTYTDRTGAVHHYTLADLDLRLVQAVEGTYFPAEETLEFSDVPFAFILSTTEAKADFAALGHIETVAVATRAWGTLTTAGELTLNLSYVGTYGSGTLTLNAH